MNSGSRVHPHANHSHKEDLEFELPYTLEQARWSEHRQKIGLPTLAGIKLDQRQKAADVNKLQKDQSAFIRQKFHVKECARFVHDKSAKAKVPVCHCGEVEVKHYYALQSKQPVLGQDVSYGLNNLAYSSGENRSPMKLQGLRAGGGGGGIFDFLGPARPYSFDMDMELHECNSFGKIDFLEDDVRRKKPAKYVRVTDTDSVDDIVTLMMNFWRLNEPQLANLVITVIGGAKNFKLDGRMRDIFNRGLMKAAKSTSAWLISSGCNMGVMKAVGDALREGQSFTWNSSEGAMHQVRGIGIAPWGYVDQRENLVGHSGEGLWPAHYKPYTQIQHGRPVSLNPDHTHFLLVDDGRRGRYGGVADFRAKLERKISSPETAGGLGIPLVLVVVEGGTDAINDCYESLKHNVPAVICDGTGRAANILAYAYINHKLDIRLNKRVLKARHKSYLRLLIIQAYGKSWTGSREENSKVCESLLDKVIKCCEKEQLITIFNMNHHQALDRAILNALLKSQGATAPEQLKDQLQLALAWNRSDIAADKILLDDIAWPTGSLDNIMTQALMEDKVDFVKLLMENGVVMQEYLTVKQLRELYNKSPAQSPFRTLLKKAGAREIGLRDVSKLLEKFLGSHDASFYNDAEPQPAQGVPQAEEHLPEISNIQDPNMELFVWAVLLNKQELAKFIWERCDNALPAAISASCIFRKMASNVPGYDSELRDDYLRGMSDFENLAVSLANECFETSAEKACMLVEQRHAAWGGKSCLEIAALAENRLFVATQVSQTVLNTMWKRGVRSSNTVVFFYIFILPLIVKHVDHHSIGIDDEELSSWQKLRTFYRAPITKFITNTTFYIAFLLLYSYMVLFNLAETTYSPQEILVWVWVLTMIMEAFREALAFHRLSVRQRVMHWFKHSVWNKLDSVKFTVMITCFALRLSLRFLPYGSPIDPRNLFTGTKYLYCFNVVLMFVSLFRTYSASPRLGPYLLIIRKMFLELTVFLAILLIPVAAYGVAVHGMLYENLSPNWTTVQYVFSVPFLQIFGMVNTDYLAGNVGNGCNGTAMTLPDGTQCPPYDWLVFVMLAAYLLAVNVLLLNLLIAVFNNVYNRVSENSLEIWKFDMFYLVEEFDRRPSLAPPLIIFEHIYMLGAYIARKVRRNEKPEVLAYNEQHTGLLKIFEKEMLQRYLTRLREAEASSMETKISTILRSTKTLEEWAEEQALLEQQQQEVEQEDAAASQHGDASQELQHGSAVDATDSRWPTPVELAMATGEHDTKWKEAARKAHYESKESQKDFDEKLQLLDSMRLASRVKRRISLIPPIDAKEMAESSKELHRRRIRTKDRLRELEERIGEQESATLNSLHNIEELLKSAILNRGVVEGYSRDVRGTAAADGLQTVSVDTIAAGAQAASAIEFATIERQITYQ